MRRVLFGGTVAAVSLVCAAVRAQSPAPVPQAPEPANAATGEPTEIIVSGVLASLESTIETKRAADTLVDAISAEDIDKFTILPSEFVSKVEVYKEPTADLGEGGLADTIEGADDSNRGECAPRASGFYSDVFAILDQVFASIYLDNMVRSTVMGTLQARPDDHWELIGEGKSSSHSEPWTPMYEFEVEIAC